jgi:hypothetical protein
MYNNREIAERRRVYEANPKLLKTGEMPLEKYLKERLSEGERDAISKLFLSLEMVYKANSCLMALAVGTTTFPDGYWDELEKFLKEKDPSKLEYVKRRGEDIDILLAPDFLTNCRFCEQPGEFLEQDLKNLGINFEFEERGSESGANYFDVPKELQEKYGRVIRTKGKDYCLDRYKINLQNSRQIHLWFDDMATSENRIAFERIWGYPFSILFRRTRVGDLRDLAESLNRE